MAKIVRYNGNLVPFASSALGTERTLFGEVTQANDITSQFTADFLRGWGIVGPSDQPTLQDFNAVSYTHGQILSYLHQAGVAEYDAAQEYFSGSVTQIGGDMFISLQAANIGNAPASSPTFWRNLSAIRNIVAESLNAKMIIAAASASGTLSADQITVAESITGRTYRLDSFSKTINLSTTGAGGMDTGSAPTSGYVGIYAIYNPVTGVSALIAVNATAATVAEVYGGANMPAGYTASALLAVYPTNGSGQFVVGDIIGRLFSYRNPVSPLTTNAVAASITTLPASGSFPKNAKLVNGFTFVNSTAASAGQGALLLFQTATSASEFAGVIGAVSNVFGIEAPFSSLPVTSAQTLFYTATGPVTPLFKIIITGYRF